MKKLILATAILLSCLAITSAKAQIRVNVNIGSQPEWGPVGYNYANYYYMPDIDTYYSIPTHQYIYYQNNDWIRTSYLPSRYRNYDLYHGYKVVINDRDPWLRDNEYRERYANYRGRRDQIIIRDSPDERYRNHWDNGKHKGWYKNEGKEWKHKNKHDDEGDDEGDD